MPFLSVEFYTSAAFKCIPFSLFVVDLQFSICLRMYHGQINDFFVHFLHLAYHLPVVAVELGSSAGLFVIGGERWFQHGTYGQEEM